MKNLKISFAVAALPMYVISLKNGRKTLDVQAFDGELTAAVQYDFYRLPLQLNARVNVGDLVQIILMDHRIELYVNGAICDEEWPCGERLFDIGDEFITNGRVECLPYTPKTPELPNIIGTIEKAEGWYPGGGIFVGDCMPYKRDGEYHVLYLKDRHHHKSKWGLGAHQWEHISTADFKSWNMHPMAVPITDPSEGSICTGSWIRDGEVEYLYYTVRRGGGIPAPISRSVSRDGYHFEKDAAFSFTVSEKYHAESARDPKVVKGKDGLYHMFLTTSLAKENLGCLAHYTSRDMQAWQELDEPIYVAPSADQPECPDYFEYQGRYYLVFSLRGRAHYMISDEPFEGFVMPSDPIIPCASVPKCAEWEDRLIFTGFRSIGGYGGSLTFKAARADSNGKLIFEEL